MITKTRLNASECNSNPNIFKIKMADHLLLKACQRIERRHGWPRRSRRHGVDNVVMTRAVQKMNRIRCRLLRPVWECVYARLVQ